MDDKIFYLLPCRWTLGPLSLWRPMADKPPRARPSPLLLRANRISRTRDRPRPRSPMPPISRASLRAPDLASSGSHTRPWSRWSWCRWTWTVWSCGIAYKTITVLGKWNGIQNYYLTNGDKLNIQLLHYYSDQVQAHILTNWLSIQFSFVHIIQVKSAWCYTSNLHNLTIFFWIPVSLLNCNPLWIELENLWFVDCQQWFSVRTVYFVTWLLHSF